MASLLYSSSGRCDFCHLDCLKITPLACLKHFCCINCKKYVDSNQKGKFSCKQCERKDRENKTGRRRESKAIDTFIDGASGKRKNSKFTDVQLTMSGPRVISLDDDLEENDQIDLTGNNDEWENLICSLSYKPSCAETDCEKNPRAKSKTPSPIKSPKSEKFTQRSPPHKIQTKLPWEENDKSRIYDWCLAAERSLTSAPNTKSKCEPETFTSESLSSSSENIMGMKKFLQQSKKKDRPIWDDGSDTEEEDWSQCFAQRTATGNDMASKTNEKDSKTGKKEYCGIDFSKNGVINIPIGQSEENHPQHDWIPEDSLPKYDEKDDFNNQEHTIDIFSKENPAQQLNSLGFQNKSPDLHSSEATSINTKSLSESFGWNGMPKKYCHNDINFINDPQNKLFSSSGDSEQANRQNPVAIENSSILNSCDAQQNEYGVKEGVNQCGLSSAAQGMYGKYISDKLPFGRGSLKCEEKGMSGIESLDWRGMREERLSKDHSDGESSDDCGTIEGMSDHDTEDEESQWLDFKHSRTQVDLDDAFWDQ